jgi:hypothetical protein
MFQSSCASLHLHDHLPSIKKRAPRKRRSLSFLPAFPVSLHFLFPLSFDVTSVSIRFFPLLRRLRLFHSSSMISAAPAFCCSYNFCSWRGLISLSCAPLNKKSTAVPLCFPMKRSMHSHITRDCTCSHTKVAKISAVTPYLYPRKIPHKIYHFP